jgi:hypothetical protein
MANLRDALSNMTTTENGATSFKSTGSFVLDFFAHAGAIRTGGEGVERVVPLFAAAHKENPGDAIVAAFYLRDVRGGQGEREAFRLILQYLADKAPRDFERIARLVPEYGRWDDLLIFGPHKNVGALVIDYVRQQFLADYTAACKNEAVTLLGKYMPSGNTSSKDTRALAEFWMKRIEHVNPTYRGNVNHNWKRYRKMLTRLRTVIGIPEQFMSARRWSEIAYEKVPSRAMYILRKAFAKHDPERFQAYLDAVKSGTKKINSSTLYPYEIMKKIIAEDTSETLELMWLALKNYFGDDIRNVVCVCDTSGSMRGTPLEVAVSLTLYAAERSNGMFADTAIVFNEKPSFRTIPRGDSLTERYRKLLSGWGGNTNFQAVFDLILDTAMRANIRQEDMPDVVFCISDMQFDEADGLVSYGSRQVRKPTNFEALKAKYAAAGYKLPRFVMWNVRAASDQPVEMKEENVFLVSGCSPVIFENALKLDTSVVTPVDAMLHVLHTERFAPVYAALSDVTSAGATTSMSVDADINFDDEWERMFGQDEDSTV